MADRYVLGFCARREISVQTLQTKQKTKQNRERKKKKEKEKKKKVGGGGGGVYVYTSKDPVVHNRIQWIMERK